jgi:hypothetical protein
MKNYVKLFADLYKTSPNILCIYSAIIVFLIDIITGEDIHFPIFFAVPAGLAAWQLNRTMAYTLSIVLPLLRVGFFSLWNNGQLNLISFINAFIIIVALSAYVYLITRIVFGKRDLERQLKHYQEKLSKCTCGELQNDEDEQNDKEKNSIFG